MVDDADTSTNGALSSSADVVISCIFMRQSIHLRFVIDALSRSLLFVIAAIRAIASSAACICDIASTSHMLIDVAIAAIYVADAEAATAMAMAAMMMRIDIDTDEGYGFTTRSIDTAGVASVQVCCLHMLALLRLQSKVLLPVLAPTRPLFVLVLQFVWLAMRARAIARVLSMLASLLVSLRVPLRLRDSAGQFAWI